MNKLLEKAIALVAARLAELDVLKGKSARFGEHTRAFCLWCR